MQKIFCILRATTLVRMYRNEIHFKSKFVLLDEGNKIKGDKKNIKEGLTNAICGVPMPIRRRLAQPFNELDDLTVYSEVFEPFLERSLPWQIKLRERSDSDIVNPNYRVDFRRGRFEFSDYFNRGFCYTDCCCDRP